MPVNKPDSYQHNNPANAFVDGDFVRGGPRIVANTTALYALSANADQLKQNVTEVFVTSLGYKMRLIDITNIGNSNGWAQAVAPVVTDATPTSGSANPVQSGGVYSALAAKVDKATGFGLSSNDYTSTEKAKLATLTKHYQGKYATLSALQTAVPTGTDGDYAIVTASPNDQEFIWDSDHNAWVLTQNIPASTFAALGGNPSDNASLNSALNSLYPLSGGDLNAGAYVGLPPLSSDPATPSAGARLYYNSGLSWLGPNGFRRTFSGSGLTASRTWSLPDQAGTLELVLPVVTAATIGDANYTATVPAVIELGTITANRVLTLPAPSATAGRVFRIFNQNNNAYNWSFAGNVVDLAGNTITNMIGRRVYQLVSDGTNYIINGDIQNETLITAAGTYTIANGVSIVRVNPNSVIASLTINFPTTPGDRDRLGLYFGGTITNGLVAAILILPTATLGALPQYAQAGNVYIYEYSAASGKWIAQNTSAVISQINAQAPDMTGILLETSAWGNVSGKNGDFLQITGVDNSTGAYGQVNQEYPLPGGIWCYCIAATLSGGTSGTATWQRFRTRMQLDSTLYASLITILTSTGTWDANNSLSTSQRSYVGAWYAAATGYIYYCYAENSPGSGGTWYWRRIGAGIPTISLEITTADHPHLIANLVANSTWPYLETADAGNEAAQQGQVYIDYTNNHKYERWSNNKWFKAY